VRCAPNALKVVAVTLSPSQARHGLPPFFPRPLRSAQEDRYRSCCSDRSRARVEECLPHSCNFVLCNSIYRAE